MIKGLDVVVVVGRQNLEVEVIVDVTDADIEAVAAEARVTLAVAFGVVAGAREGVVARPGRDVPTGGLVGAAVGVEDEDLSATGRGVDCLGCCDDNFDIEVAVEVGGGQAAHLWRVASSCGVGRPATLDGQLAADPLPGEDLVRPARHNFDGAVAVEVGDHVWRIDSALLVSCPVEEGACGVEDEDVVVGRDDLVRAVAVEVGNQWGGVPAGLAAQISDKDRRLHRTAAPGGMTRR